MFPDAEYVHPLRSTVPRLSSLARKSNVSESTQAAILLLDFAAANALPSLLRAFFAHQ